MPDTVNADGATPPIVETALSLTAVSKHFGRQLVLDNFALALAPGEVHGLVGHNGSGKSTLVKILAGFHKPDPGAGAQVAGKSLALGDSHEARSAGLRFVHQDLGLVGNLDAVDNLHLDVPYPRRRSGGIAWPAARRQAVELLASLGYEFDTRRPIEELAPADRTGVALARALSDWEADAKVLVLDEPTAALPVEAVGRLFEAIRAVSARGIAVLYISHHLDELFDICDELTVLREGRIVASVKAASLDHEGLVELMLGKSLQLSDHQHRRSAPTGDPALVVRDLGSERIGSISFTVARGEVLGVAGIAGSGREDLAAALYGAISCTGSVEVLGQAVAPGRPDESVQAGMGLVPAHRLRNGLIGTMSVRENLTIASIPAELGGVRLNHRIERKEAGVWLQRLEVQPPEPDRPVISLSGGNQQRVVLARWLRLRPAVLLLDEPTQGVDIGAIQLIYSAIRDAAADGMAAVVCSSSADELVALCDRVLVMRRGRLERELEGERIDGDAIDALTLIDTEGQKCT